MFSGVPRARNAIGFPGLVCRSEGPVLEFSNLLNYVVRAVKLSGASCEVESRTYCGGRGPRVEMRVGSLRCVYAGLAH
jgi:hypothetical protein